VTVEPAVEQRESLAALRAVVVGRSRQVVQVERRAMGTQGLQVLRIWVVVVMTKAAAAAVGTTAAAVAVTTVVAGVGRVTLPC
jgi:hypothetical protein